MTIPIQVILETLPIITAQRKRRDDKNNFLRSGQASDRFMPFDRIE